MSYPLGLRFIFIFKNDHPARCEASLYSLNHLSLLINATSHVISGHILSISSLENLFKFLIHFLIVLSLYLSCRNHDVFWILDAYFTNPFSDFVNCLFESQKCLIWKNPMYFFFLLLLLVSCLRNGYINQGHKYLQVFEVL